jgi:hypothetical protein
MSIYKYLGCSTAVMAGVMLTWVAPTKAFLYPVAPAATSYIQHVDCAAGFHVGPVGTCVIGTDEPHDRVMERRDDHAGCDTKSVTRQDEAGNSETKTKTNC